MECKKADEQCRGLGVCFHVKRFFLPSVRPESISYRDSNSECMPEKKCKNTNDIPAIRHTGYADKAYLIGQFLSALKERGQP